MSEMIQAERLRALASWALKEAMTPEEFVRFVLLRIRKPTPEMIKAGSRKVSCYIADFYVAEMFTEMIDEMLK